MDPQFSINCDLGESFGRYSLIDEESLMPYIQECNIACGFHAGDPVVIERTIKSAIRYGLSIGAHPSFPDLQGFGRRKMNIPKLDLVSILRYQICAIKSLTECFDGVLNHVKAHGALYNMAAVHKETASAICEAVISVSQDLLLFVPFNSVLAQEAQIYGLTVKYEGFIDRAYHQDLTLVSREVPGSLIEDPEKACDQLMEMCNNNRVKTIEGSFASINASTFCIHGDNPGALDILRYIHEKPWAAK